MDRWMVNRLVGKEEQVYRLVGGVGSVDREMEKFMICGWVMNVGKG